jgi:hypothetical protein
VSIRRSTFVSTSLALLSLVGPSSVWPQIGPSGTGAGPHNPTVFRIAPGQVMRVWVNNVKALLPYEGGTSIRAERATSVPLPTSLAGFSARIIQEGKTFPVPLFAAEQVPVCAYTMQNPAPATPECWSTAITVQIPVDIEMFPGPTTLVVTERGTDGAPIAVFPYDDNIRILTRCDSQLNFVQGDRPDACVPIVTHADGTLVTSGSPAKAADTVVIYAYGLGKTTPAIGAGQRTPAPAPFLGSPRFPRIPPSILVGFDFRVNASPSLPYITPATDPASITLPEFRGLTPGQVGLYQINVKLPEVLPAVAPCTVDNPRNTPMWRLRI